MMAFWHEGRPVSEVTRQLEDSNLRSMIFEVDVLDMNTLLL